MGKTGLLALLVNTLTEYQEQSRFREHLCAAYTPSFPCRSVFLVLHVYSLNRTFKAVDDITTFRAGISISGLLVRHW